MKRIEKVSQGFSISVVCNDKLVLPFLKLIKQYYKKTKVVVGGTFTTIYLEMIVKNKYVDTVCMGEGEFAIPKCMNRAEKINFIKQIIYRLKQINEIIKCTRIVIDNLPFPDRKIMKQTRQIGN